MAHIQWKFHNLNCMGMNENFKFRGFKLQKKGHN